MKIKFLIASLAAAVTFQASAAPVAQDTAFQLSGDVSGGTTGACSLLAENVTLNLSARVWGVYNCDEATSVIRVAACHEGGSRKARTVNCAEDTANPGTYLPQGCTATTPTIEITDYAGYVAGSNGGSVAVNDLGGRCEASTVTGLID
ncbi:MAG: hypothetical protein FH750_08485 [Pseudomonas stutzeri]|uniref:hypothetical protein n=1 Tax=Stutzerimonas stutzeri TaxID=316 RepID=UPI001428FC1B|nr:hypothetical protein [Stutzerimonas stutzeri]MDH0121435.1 hypothetical protein [Stutzerimonas stutzeri]MTI91388.1 hypothetical protein [Stutzerimonas stutzeri]